MVDQPTPQPVVVTDRRVEDARLWLAAIVDFSNDAIISRDLEGVILTWNLAAERLFGYSEKEMVGQPIAIIVPPELREEERDILRRLRAGELIEHHETRRVTRDGRYIDVSLTISPVRDAEGTILGISKILRDITESKQRFHLIANSVPVTIWMTDVANQCTYVNQPWIDLTGRSFEAALGEGWADDIHPGDVERAWQTYTQASDRRESFQVEYRVRRHDGEYRWITDTGVPRYNEDGSFAGYIGSAVDVTERKLANEALSTLSQRLFEAREDECARLARELHDDVNQRLALVNIRLGRLAQVIPATAAGGRREIEALGEEVGRLARDVQALSHRLHPSQLEHLGIAEASAALCREISGQHGVEVRFDAESVPEGLSARIAMCLYRVLQEALQNAIKHSGTGKVDVSLRGGTDQIELTIDDFGVGFDLEATRGHGLGLTSMNERLKAVEGDLAIRSQPQRGTSILARVPLLQQRERPR